MSRDYTETLRDVRKAVQQERDETHRKELMRDVDALDRDFREMRQKIEDVRLVNARFCDDEKVKQIADEAVKVLAERVDWHTWLLRGVIIASVVEIMGGVIVALLVHGTKL